MRQVICAAILTVRELVRPYQFLSTAQKLSTDRAGRVQRTSAAGTLTAWTQKAGAKCWFWSTIRRCCTASGAWPRRQTERSTKSTSPAPGPYGAPPRSSYSTPGRPRRAATGFPADAGWSCCATDRPASTSGESPPLSERSTCWRCPTTSRRSSPFSESNPSGPTRTAPSLAVVGGCGGAGTSTLAAATALAGASRPQSTLLVETDAWGSGLDVLLGIEDAPGLRWSGLSIEGGRISSGALRDALPAHGEHVRVLACSRKGTGGAGPTAAAVRAVADAGRHAGDLVVCDVSRFPGPVTETIVDIADLVVLLVPATVRACIAAGKVSQWITERNPNQGLVVRGPAPGGLRGVDVAAVLDLPLIASMRAERTLTGMLEHGGLRPGRRSPLGAAADAVLDTLGNRPRSREWAA